ncbi:MAG: hypothetical protein HY711_00080 [Candidatus Melainabacteria bacterium]|nr:hypothetical protein [Candidatus Melainabacteria bacterium]
MEIFWELGALLSTVACPVAVFLLQHLLNDDCVSAGDIVGPTYWGRYQGAPVVESMNLKMIHKPNYSSQAAKDSVVYLP